jgi:hypothetical protein
MTEKAARRFNWQLPLCGAAAAVIALLPKIVFGNDVGALLLTLLFAFTASLVLLVVAVIQTIRRQGFSSLAMLIVFCGLSWFLFRASDYLRTTGRWLVESRHYESELLAKSPSASGELKHLEWDEWGFPGAGDTVVYLIFDTDDLLAKEARSRPHGEFSGIPCKVVAVRRLESQWYTVLFYTDTDWDHCA